MRINFICRGNVWRSRLAEAYAKSLLTGNKNIQVSSSGIEASKDYDGPVNPLTKQLLEKDDLWQYIHPEWIQTTQQLIDSSNLLVFMNKDIFEDAMQTYKVPDNKAVVWDVPDEDWVYEDIKLKVKDLILSNDKRKIY